MKNRIVTRIVWFCVAAVLVYTAFIVYTDSRRNIEVFKAFPWKSLPLILLLVVVNFLLRELKWDYFRRAARINAPRFGSFLVFFSGFSMAISPGRVGELIKPFMYKEYFGARMRRSIPLVLCERISDLLGMIVLALGALPFYMQGVERARGPIPGTGIIYTFLILSAIAVVAGLYVLRHKRLMYGILIRAGRIHKLRPTLRKIMHMYHSTWPLLTMKNLLVTTAMAAVSWSFEYAALDMILSGVGAPQVQLVEAAFVFSVATIFGGFLFFLPGGLGGFEAAMYRLLDMLAISPNQIVPAILITRFSTLFFAVAVGFLFIGITSYKYHKGLKWEEFESARDNDEDEKPV